MAERDRAARFPIIPAAVVAYMRDLEAALAACREEAERQKEQIRSLVEVDLKHAMAERDAALGRVRALEAFVRHVEKFARSHGHGQIPNWDLIAEEARTALAAGPGGEGGHGGE